MINILLRPVLAARALLHLDSPGSLLAECQRVDTVHLTQDR